MVYLVRFFNSEVSSIFYVISASIFFKLKKGQELRVDETSKQLNWSLTDQQPLVVFSEDFAISQGELRLSQLPDLDDDFYHFSHLESTTVRQTSEVAQHIHDIDTKVKIFHFSR